MSRNNASLTKGVGHSIRPHSAPLPKAVSRSNRCLGIKTDSGIKKRSSVRVQEQKLLYAFNAIGLDVNKEKPSEKPSLTNKLQTEINELSSKVEKHKKNLKNNISKLNKMYNKLNALSPTKPSGFMYEGKFYSSKKKLQEEIDIKLELISGLKVSINKNELKIMQKIGVLDVYTFNKELNSLSSNFGATKLSPVKEAISY